MLPISPCSTSMRCLSGSMRRPTWMRLRTSASGSRDEDAEHGAAAGDLEHPAGAALARRRELGEQRDAVAAREDLERHDQRLPRRVPLQIEVGAVDVDPAQRLVGVDDVALVELDAALRSSSGCRRRRSARARGRSPGCWARAGRRRCATPAAGPWPASARSRSRPCGCRRRRARRSRATARAARRLPSSWSARRRRRSAASG